MASFFPSLSIKFHITGRLSVRVSFDHRGVHQLTLIKHGSPDSSYESVSFAPLVKKRDIGSYLTNRVDAGHAVRISVHMRVRGKTGAVRVSTNARRRVVDPGAHGVALRAGVGGLEADGGGHEVAPALSHSAGLQGVQAVAIGGATGQAVRQAVGVLVDDDAGVEGAVALRRGAGPDVHAHARHLAVGRGGEVGVVGAGAVLVVLSVWLIGWKNDWIECSYLGVEDDLVVATTTSALLSQVSNQPIEEYPARDRISYVVVNLKVASSLVEPKRVEEIVVHVGSVEQLSHAGIHVG